MAFNLEEMTAEERAIVNLGRLVGQMLQDQQLAAQTKRLLRQKQPTLNFPELDAEDVARKAREEASAEVQKLRDEINGNKARALLQVEERKIEEAGLDPKEVREFMNKRGTTDVDMVIELFQSRMALAEPSTPQFQPVQGPNLKEMWENPVAWREKEAHKVLDEMHGRTRVRQVQ